MSDLQQTLRDLHRELADVPQLDPEQRAMLEAALGGHPAGAGACERSRQRPGRRPGR